MRKWWIVAFVLVLVLAVGGIAYAAKVQGAPKRAAGSFPGRSGASLAGRVAQVTGMKVQDVLKDRQAGKSYSQIITANGKDPSTVISQMVADRKAFLDKLVAAGKLTQEKAATQLKSYEASVKTAFESTEALPAPKSAKAPKAPGAADKPAVRAAMPGRNIFAEISKATGVTVQDLMKERRSGKSYSDILAAKGKDAAAFMSQLVSQVKQELDKLVAEGKLTQEKATAYLAKYETNLKTIMADTTVRQPRAGAPKTPRTNVTPKKPL